MKNISFTLNVAVLPSVVLTRLNAVELLLASNLHVVSCTLHLVTTFVPGTPLKVHPVSIPMQVNCMSGKTHCSSLISSGTSL